MDIFQSISGILQIELVSAQSLSILKRITEHNVPLFTVKHIDELTVQCTIFRRDYKTVQKIILESGGSCKIVHKNGIHWLIENMKRRIALLFGLTIVLLAALFIPTRIFFVNVTGNSMIPTEYILEKARENGISFGASRRAVRSEKVKNALLEAIPELQWAGINTEGCVATISVKEKSVASETSEPDKVSSIVADRDGIIVSCTVERGRGLCQPGQAVTEGQILVSGYIDSGLMVTATNAKAEIFAQTKHDLIAVSPAVSEKRGAEVKEECRYSLRIGKKLIKFYKDSGISDGTCVKMYEEDYWLLPGGLRLPIALVTERWIYYDVCSQQVFSEAEFQWLYDAARKSVLNNTVAGQILDENASILLYDDVCIIQGRYACLEMIGKNKTEEILYKYGENG